MTSIQMKDEMKDDMERAANLIYGYVPPAAPEIGRPSEGRANRSASA